jgi:hypothetical protein
VAAACVFLMWAASAGSGTAAARQNGIWRAAPEYLPLAAPAGERRGAYRTYVSALGIDEVLRQLGTGWPAKPVSPFDAFGPAGRYDRFKLARLYGSSQPRVARGPRPSADVVTEAWTLISPYPEPAMARLQPGTLLIVLSLGPSRD